MYGLIRRLLGSLLIRFLTVGSLGALVGLAILYVLTEWCGLFYLASLGIGWLIVSYLVYMGNCGWTFKSFKGFRGFVKFVVSRAGTTVAGFGLVALMTSGLGIWYMASPVIGTLIMTAFNFLIAKRWIWKENVGENAKKP